MSEVNYKEIGKKIRVSILDTFDAGKRGHVPSAFSLVEILNVFYEKILNYDAKNPKKKDRDRLILSKGHGCLALYAVLANKGFFPKEELLKFCHADGILGGHPEKCKVPGVEASTGSLGHGLPLGVGMAWNAKANKEDHKIYVVMGDGECQEGSVWEAALSASKNKLDNLVALVDYNKHQSCGTIAEVCGLEPFADKWTAFGFNSFEVDMDYPERLEELLSDLPKGKPVAIICHTIKGKGIKEIENDLTWHHKSRVSPEEIQKLKDALGDQ
ncbi:MAG: transketolase [Bacteriovoracaceae bacterium]|jgi:transketolase